MAFLKYSESIRFYRDLFEGEIYSEENQKILSCLDKNLKQKILLCLAREYKVTESYSILSWLNKENNYKLEYYNSVLIQSLQRIHPLNYINSLSPIDRSNIDNLIFNILHDHDKGIFRYKIQKVTAIGSTTYDDSYWEELGSIKNMQEKITKRVENKGNDIDLMLTSTYRLDHDLNWLSWLIKDLLSKYNVRYDFNEDKKEDGTTYLLVPKSHQDQYGTLFEWKVINYWCPNFIIHFPEGRPIHLVLDKNYGEYTLKREYLEWRPHSILFNDIQEMIVFKKYLEWEDQKILNKFEDRYDQLIINKRNNFRKKLQSTNSKIERDRRAAWNIDLI